MPKALIIILLASLVAACSDQEGKEQAKAQVSTGMAGHQMGDSGKSVSVKTPNVPFKFGAGMELFRDKCSACHGKWGGGTDQGPPLMHAFYKPSHHDNSSFYRAIRNGVKAHHWKFGNMPPVAGLTPEDAEKVLPFIRWLQQENGIY